MDSSSSAHAINYDQLEQERSLEIQQNLQKKLEEVSRKSRGQLDSLHQGILNLVVTENYEHAREELIAYTTDRTDFPLFSKKVEPYVKHILDLISAVKAKRHFPGLATLSLSKQQEIHEKVLDHFEELKTHLKRIERVERENKLADLRSTAWFLKIAANCVILIASVAFVMELQHGLWHSFQVVFDALLNNLTDWMSRLIG